MKGVDHHEGGVTLTGEAIPMFRLTMMLRGIKMEMGGMRLTRGVSCYALAKREFGFKGNKEKVYTQLLALIQGRMVEQQTTEQDIDAMLKAGSGGF